MDHQRWEGDVIVNKKEIEQGTFLDQLTPKRNKPITMDDLKGFCGCGCGKPYCPDCSPFNNYEGDELW